MAFDDEVADKYSRLRFQLRLLAGLYRQAFVLRSKFIVFSVHRKELQGKLVGIATLAPNHGLQALPLPIPESLSNVKFAVVSNMAVDANVRQQGLGRALLRECERAAVEQGYGAIALLVHQYNEPALR